MFCVSGNIYIIAWYPRLTPVRDRISNIIPGNSKMLMDSVEIYYMQAGDFYPRSYIYVHIYFKIIYIWLLERESSPCCGNQ